MSMDLKNNVLGSLRTAWQSLARLPVAALPPVEEGESSVEGNLQETHGKPSYSWTFVCWCVCKFASNPLLTSSSRPSLHADTLHLCLLLCLVVVSSFPHPLLLNLEPQPQWQSLLLLRGKTGVVTCGVKYWSGPGPFIDITSKVSQGAPLPIQKAASS